MIVMSQLLQVLQSAEAAVPQSGDLAENPGPGGLAKFFGAILEQARRRASMTAPALSLLRWRPGSSISASPHSRATRFPRRPSNSS